MGLRYIAEQALPPIGLGCMNLSHAYGTPPSKSDATDLLHFAIDNGAEHFDSAALYGFGRNEQLLGEALKGNVEHAIAALQTEYSLMTRNAEIAVLEKCAELNLAFVAFSPLSRGFFSGNIKQSDDLVDGDIRKGMPRFQTEHLSTNLPLLAKLAPLCEKMQCSAMQLSLAWVLHKGEHIHVIPGTTNIQHLQDNINAKRVMLSPIDIDTLDSIFTPSVVSGARYPNITQLEIDTEEF